MFVVILPHLRVVVATLGPKSNSLGSSPSRGVRNSRHRDNGTQDNAGRPGASRTDQGVTVVVIGFHGHGRHGQVCAVNRHHSSLCQSCSGVVVLHNRLNRDDRNEQEDD